MRTIDLLYQAYADERMERAESGEEQEAVSYTHLTLPTT